MQSKENAYFLVNLQKCCKTLSGTDPKYEMQTGIESWEYSMKYST